MKNFALHKRWFGMMLGGLAGALLAVIGLRLVSGIRVPTALVVILLAASFGVMVGSMLGSTGKGAEGPSAHDCLLGVPMSEAKQTDFFAFFNLEETGSSTDAKTGKKILIFKPSGSAFRELVTVKVMLAGDDRIGGLELLMRREFVDSPVNGVFARDIAKSLLRSALPSVDRTAIADLINEIEYRRPPNAQPMIVGPGYKPPPLPAQPTAGYQSYLGQRTLYEQSLPSARHLRLENAESDGAKILLISVR